MSSCKILNPSKSVSTQAYIFPSWVPFVEIMLYLDVFWQLEHVFQLQTKIFPIVVLILSEEWMFCVWVVKLQNIFAKFIYFFCKYIHQFLRLLSWKKHPLASLLLGKAYSLQWRADQNVWENVEWQLGEMAWLWMRNFMFLVMALMIFLVLAGWTSTWHHESRTK